MIRNTLILLMIVGALLGCRETDRPTSSASERSIVSPPEDSREAAILAFAERKLQEQYPEAYRQHKPYIAQHVPNSNIWRVKPASGIKAGAPSVQVLEAAELRLIAIDIAK